MRKKSLKTSIVGVLAIVLVLAFAWTTSTLAKTKSDPVVPEIAIWELTKASVVDPGQTVQTKQGTLTTGYTIVAKAKAKDNKLVPEGEFRLTLSSFSPKKDLPGQKAGRWYVQGTWTITKNNADPDTVKVRHNPDFMKGDLRTELTFDPTTSQENWTAAARLPMSLAAGQWARGEGTYTVNGQFEGDLFLDLGLWPEVQ